MIERERDHYRNRKGNTCKYPKANSITYETGETESDKQIAEEILNLTKQLKGIQYLQTLKTS